MKFFVISPACIIGEMIIKGIARGFEAFGHDVLLYDTREIDFKKVEEFAPDYAFGMDYFNFMQQDVEQFIEKLGVPCINYFIDAPKSKYANGGQEDFFEKLNSQPESVIFCWDEKYLGDFANGAHYLSTGIDFELYKQDYPELDIAPSKILFAGRPLEDRRESHIAQVVKNFPDALSIYSYGPHFERSVENMRQKGFLNEEEIESYKKCYKGFLRDEKELAAAYHRADMILNITLEQGLSSMNSRVLESLATGSFLISDYVEDTAKYFTEGEEVILYRSPEELVQLIAKYIDAPEEKAKVQGKALAKIEKNHTLLSRAEAILKVLEA